MKRSTIFLILAVAVVLGAIGAYFFLPRRITVEETQGFVEY